MSVLVIMVEGLFFLKSDEVVIGDFRKVERGVSDIFVRRWSSHALSKGLSRDDLLTLFEAARWAPSSHNSQPWRFIYSFNGSDSWGGFFDLLVDFNKSWVKDASVLILVVSRKNFEYNESFSRSHSFDAGAAWQNFALQASLSGFVAHAIGGFDFVRARVVGNVSDDFEVEAMIAVGLPGLIDSLPDMLRGRQVPSSRKSVEEFVFEGKLP